MDWSVNWIAVVLGAVANMLLGWAWYSPMLFGKKWAILIGSPMEDTAAWEARKAGMRKIYGVTFVAAIVMSFVMNWLVQALNVFTVGDAIQTAVLLWLGLVGATSLSGILFEKRPVALWAINTGYTLVSFIIVSLIAIFWS